MHAAQQASPCHPSKGGIKMSVLTTSDNNQLIVTCSCGCQESLHIEITDFGDGDYCYLSYLNGNWYREQRGFLDKLKKIWRILTNRDYCYSEICLSKDSWEEYKRWVNSH